MYYIRNNFYCCYLPYFGTNLLTVFKVKHLMYISCIKSLQNVGLSSYSMRPLFLKTDFNLCVIVQPFGFEKNIVIHLIQC